MTPSVTGTHAMFSILTVYATLLFTFAAYTTASQPSPRDLDTRDGQGAWTNAYCIPSQPQDLSPATVATCPSWSPISCTAIGEAS
jgi:ABC-type transport system substrate-binding protein